MFGQPDFNNHYDNLLKQLPPSMKKDVWLRLTTRKNNPLSEEQARGIRPDIEELLTSNINIYIGTIRVKIVRRLESKQMRFQREPLPFSGLMDLRNS